MIYIIYYFYFYFYYHLHIYIIIFQLTIPCIYIINTHVIIFISCILHIAMQSSILSTSINLGHSPLNPREGIFAMQSSVRPWLVSTARYIMRKKLLRNRSADRKEKENSQRCDALMRAAGSASHLRRQDVRKPSQGKPASSRNLNRRDTLFLFLSFSPLAASGEFRG